MKIAFFYDSKMKEIGVSHIHRSEIIGKLLTQNGHNVEYTEEDIVMADWDVLIIDRRESCRDIIYRAKRSGTKVVLLDGSTDDAKLVDLSISAFMNPEAQYRGVKYIAIPTCQSWIKYRPHTSSQTIFVGMGSFDTDNIAEFILKILDEMSLNAVVAKSINHGNFREDFSRVEVFDEENYYDAMHECVMGITDGRTTFFQALYYGMPSIPIAQDKFQQINIDYLQHCCLPVKKDKKDIMDKIEWVVNNEYYRRSLGMLSAHYVDGRGTRRICKLIEDLR